MSDHFPSKVPLPAIEPYEPKMEQLPEKCPLKVFLSMDEKKCIEHFCRSLVYEALERCFDIVEGRRCMEIAQKCLERGSSFSVYSNTENSLFDSPEKIDFYQKNILLCRDGIIATCRETLKQSKSPAWFVVRKNRITASKNSHAIKTRKSKTIASLIQDILHPKDLSRNENLKYGLKFEEFAISEYEKFAKLPVHRLGVLISEFQPWLCASLDGIVVEPDSSLKVVEIKCPSSCKKTGIVDFETKKCFVPYLEFREEEIQLKRSHQYYTQIQIQMYVSGAKKGDLFVWSPVNSCVIKVPRDEQFLKTTILTLEDFFFKHYLAALIPEKAPKRKAGSDLDLVEN